MLADLKDPCGLPLPSGRFCAVDGVGWQSCYVLAVLFGALLGVLLLIVCPLGCQ